MNKSLVAIAATLVVMVALDLIWLGFVAKPLYQQGIGHLMAERPNVAAAVVFYVVYAVGVTALVVLPNAAAGWAATLGSAALFGFVAYATYDLSNLATLKGWPLGMSIVDMAWGTLVSAASAAAGRAALLRFDGASAY